MDISAHVVNRLSRHEVHVSTDGRAQPVAIPAKETGYGSSVNGGELLALALATCYCNDLYREGNARGIAVQSVDVQVTTRFGGVGEPAREIRYSVVLSADAADEAVRRLAEHTDSVAEIHNTIRLGMPVLLEAVSVNRPTPRQAANPAAGAGGPASSRSAASERLSAPMRLPSGDSTLF